MYICKIYNHKDEILLFVIPKHERVSMHACKLDFIARVVVIAYTFFPSLQKMVPNIRAMTVVKKILVAVYDGLRQYDLCCFHRQAMHCVMKGCEYLVGKNKSFEPGGGLLSSLIKALFLLQQFPSTSEHHKCRWLSICQLITYDSGTVNL